MENEIMTIIGTAIWVSMLVADSTRKMPRFERPEKSESDGLNINWFTLKVGTKLKVNIESMILAHEQDIVQAGYNVSEHFRDSGNIGAIITVAEPVKNGSFSWVECLVTQGRLVDDLLDIAYRFKDAGSAAFGPHSLARTGDADKWVFETVPTLVIEHIKTGNGNRTCYVATCDGLPEKSQHILEEFAAAMTEIEEKEAAN